MFGFTFPDMAREFPDVVREFQDVAREFQDMAREFQEENCVRIGKGSGSFGQSV